jgi:hypothetical protein
MQLRSDLRVPYSDTVAQNRSRPLNEQIAAIIMLHDALMDFPGVTTSERSILQSLKNGGDAAAQCIINLLIP